MIADGRHASLTISCLHTATFYKSLAFTVGRPARYVKQNENSSTPMLKGSLILSTPGFIWGCWKDGWPVNCNPSRRLPICSFSFPDTDHSLNSQYIIRAPNTGRSITFPTERNLSQFNAFYDLPHYPGYTLIQCFTPATRQRIQSIKYPHSIQDNYNVTIRCSSTKQGILPQSVLTCSTRRSE